MKRPLMIVGFSYLAALAAAYYFAPAYCFVISIVMMIAALVFAFVKLPDKIKAFSKAFPVVLAVLATGFAVNGAYMKYVYEPLENLSGENIGIKAEIVREISQNSGKYYYEIKVISSEIKKDNLNYINPIKSGTKLRLCHKGKIYAEYFDIIEFQGFLYKNNKSYLFNYEKNYISKGMPINVYAEECTTKSPNKYPVLHYIYKLKDNVVSAISENVPWGVSDVAVAVLTSQKSESFYENFDYFSKVGLSHVFSVSGLHLSIILGAIYSLLCFFKINKYLRNALVIFTAIFVVMFTGFLPSVMRSGVMAALFYLGDMIGQKADSKNSLGAAVLVILLLNPMAANDIGLILSFLSTLSIILFADKIQKKIMSRLPKHKISDFFAVPTATTLSAMVLTLPVMIIDFSGFSLISPVVNMLVVPLVPLFLILSILTGVSGLYPFLSIISKLLGIVTGALGKIITGISRLFSEIPFSFLTVSDFVTKMILSIGISLVVLFIIFYYNKKLIRIILAATVISILIYVPIKQVTNEDKLFVTLPSSESGSGVVVYQNDDAAIIGTGTDKYEGKQIADFLQSKGKINVNALICPYVNNNAATCIKDILSKIDVSSSYIDLNAERADDILYNAKQSQSIFDFQNMTISFDGGAIIKTFEYEDSFASIISYKGARILYINGKAGNIKISQEMIACDIMICSSYLSENILSEFSPSYLLICDDVKRGKIIDYAAGSGIKVIVPDKENEVAISVGKNGRISLEN